LEATAVFLRVTLILALLLTACSNREPPPSKQTLRIGGSAAARDVIEKVLADFTMDHPDLSVQHLPSTHSGAAVEALRHGELDVGYLTREPSPQERSGLYVYAFAKDSLVFAAHKEAGVVGLTTRQLRALYAGAIRNWSQLGGEDVPVVLLDRPEYTSPKRLLRAGPFGNLEIDPSAAVLESPADMDEALVTYVGSLGYTSLRAALARRDRLIILQLGGVYPDADAIRFGRYLYARTMVLAGRDPLTLAAKKLFDHVASPEGQSVVESLALVPLRREIRVAVPPMRNIVSLEVKYGGLARYLQERLGRPVELEHQASYTDLTEAFRKNRIDAAFAGSFAYLVAHLEAGVEVLARPDYDGVSHYRGVIYVLQNAFYRELEDLRGARVAHSGKATTAGYLFPVYALKKQGLPPPGAFFGEFFGAGSHEAAIRAVLEGRAEAAAAKDLVFEEMVREDPTLNEKLRGLISSPPVPSNGFAAGPLLGPELRKQIRGLLLSMAESPRGRKALRDLGAIQFIPTTDADYANLYDMVGAVSDELADFFQYR
jgi:phosphate/phosphite/phosphonate ABC transporter binding protein